MAKPNRDELSDVMVKTALVVAGGGAAFMLAPVIIPVAGTAIVVAGVSKLGKRLFGGKKDD